MAQPLKDNDWKFDWDINPNDDDYKETKKRYSKEIPSMKAKGNNQEQQSMFKVATAGRRINKPLLLYLSDSYTRSRIHFYKTNKSSSSTTPILSISKWLESNKQIQAITNNNQQNIDLLQGAIQTFYRRINSEIKFQSMEKINDKIKPFALYIRDAIHFIKKLLNGNRDLNDPTDKEDPNDIDRANPPFQVDLWIIPQKIYDPTQDETDEDTDDDTDNQNTEDEKDNDSFDIDASLSENNIPHHKYEFHEGRRMYEDYKKFKRQVKQFKDYPHNKRFCIIADRRDKPDDGLGPDLSRNEDKIYMYHPPKGNEIPNDHLCEKFMQLSYDCVLPKSKKCNAVNAKTASSKFFMLSFHVEAADEIRCYLYQRGQISRFYPKDILDVLPEFFVYAKDKQFDDDGSFGKDVDEIAKDNVKFVKEQESHEKVDVEQFVKDMEIPDVHFENSPFQEN